MRATSRRGVLLILATAMGFAGAAGVYWSAWRSVPEIKMVPAVVVTRAVGQTETVPTDALTVRQVPDAGLPPGAFDDPGGAFGKTAARPLLAGQILTKGDLAPDPLRRGLAAGEVGAAVRVPQEVGPVLRPGDLVNVIMVPKLQPGATAPPPVVLMAGKRVVALYDAAGVQVIDRSDSRIASAVNAIASAGRMDGAAGIPAFAMLALAPKESLALRDVQRTAELYLDVAPWTTGPVDRP